MNFFHNSGLKKHCLTDIFKGYSLKDKLSCILLGLLIIKTICSILNYHTAFSILCLIRFVAFGYLIYSLLNFFVVVPTMTYSDSITSDYVFDDERSCEFDDNPSNTESMSFSHIENPNNNKEEETNVVVKTVTKSKVVMHSDTIEENDKSVPKKTRKIKN